VSIRGCLPGPAALRISVLRCSIRSKSTCPGRRGILFGAKHGFAALAVEALVEVHGLDAWQFFAGLSHPPQTLKSTRKWQRNGEPS
jgi:hypothetical protein